MTGDDKIVGVGALAALTLGGGWCATGAYRWQVCTETHRWLSLPGHIVTASATTTASHGDPGSVDTECTVTYAWEHRGRRHTGDQISYGYDRMPCGHDGAAFLGRYHAGASVLVRVDPSDPSRAVLEAGCELPSLLGIVLSGAVALLGAIGCLALLRSAMR